MSWIIFFLALAGVGYFGIVWIAKSGEPTIGEDRHRFYGPWTAKFDYEYPPGLDDLSRGQFTDEEQELVEKFWYPSSFIQLCDWAGLYIPIRYNDGQIRRKYPAFLGFEREARGLRVYLKAGEGITPAQVEGAVDSMMANVSGSSPHVVESWRQGIAIFLKSRNPLESSNLDGRSNLGHFERSAPAGNFEQFAAGVGAPPARAVNLQVHAQNSTVQIARTEFGEPLFFDPFEFRHALVCGQNGSGKSVLTENILATCARHPHAQAVVIDPSSILGKPWGDVPCHGYPQQHALGPDPRLAISILVALVTEMERRTQVLAQLNRDKMPREFFTESTPAIWLVLEEYAALHTIASSRELDEGVIPMVGRLLREGRKAGIGVCTLIQRPEMKYVHDRAQYSRFFVHLLEGKTSVDMVLDDASDEQVEEVKTLNKGEFLYKELGPKPPVKAKSAFVDAADYADAVRYHVPRVGTVPVIRNEDFKPWESEREQRDREAAEKKAEAAAAREAKKKEAAK